MDRNAVLPDRCFKCNDPAEGFRRAEKVTYIPMSQQLMFGVWSYLDAKRASISIGLCERHRRSRLSTVAWISLAAIAFSFVEVSQLQPTDLLVPILAAVAFIGGCIGLVYAAFPRHIVRAADMTDTHIWLKGAGKEFLTSLPEAPVSFDQGLPTLPGTLAASTDPEASAAKVFRNARNGAILFFAGCVITAITYSLGPSRYVIALGLVVVGLARLILASRAYVGLPAERRNRQQVLALVGLVGAGLIAGGWVATNEIAAQNGADQFQTALSASTRFQNQALTL